MKTLLCTLVVAALLGGCEGRPRSSGGSTLSTPHFGPVLAVIDLSAGVPERGGASLLGLGPRRPSFDELLRAIDDAAQNKRVKGAFVRFGSAPLGLARATEIGDALDALRKAKPVHCQAEELTNATLFAAARGCTKVAIAPSGGVEAVGIAAQVVYLNKLLTQRLHLTVDILQVGKFKGAEEPLTRDGPSAEARASLVGTLSDIRASWVDGIVKGRAKPGIAEAIEDGPYPPKQAVERGLVDAIAYADEARETARKEVFAVRDEIVFGPGAAERPDDLATIVRMLASDGNSMPPVAVVRATGSISMRSEGGLFRQGEGITEHALGKTIAKLEKESSVKAVVLRIDSPGGSALASDLLWHQLMKLRAKKPLVVSVGDMAASGGYYLASAANVVFAEPTSIVGSIGVVGGKVGVADALEDWGVHAETFPANTQKPGAAARSAYLSPLIGWDEPTRVRVRESMTAIYELFVRRIAEGRSMPDAKVRESAEGRIFSGREAKTRGLVDELGGLGAAIARAKVLAKLPADASVGPVSEPPGFVDALGPNGDDEERARALGPLREELRDVLAEALGELRPAVESLAPLAHGERVVAAMPYAIVVR